jgi:hypothetical protein
MPVRRNSRPAPRLALGGSNPPQGNIKYEQRPFLYDKSVIHLSNRHPSNRRPSWECKTAADWIAAYQIHHYGANTGQIEYYLRVAARLL